jgi:hypothetical protein
MSMIENADQDFNQGGLGTDCANAKMTAKIPNAMNAGSHQTSTYEATSRQAHLMCRHDLQRAFA